MIVTVTNYVCVCYNGSFIVVGESALEPSLEMAKSKNHTNHNQSEQTHLPPMPSLNYCNQVTYRHADFVWGRCIDAYTLGRLYYIIC